jgi:hypothetical protein
MSQTLTDNAFSALKQSAKSPNMVVVIDGVDKIFGASVVDAYVRIGDDGLVIGDPETDPDAFYIGGMHPYPDQDNAITPDGTSTSIKQSLDPDKGLGSSISNLSISFMDNGYMTQLITPGVLVDDLLQRKALVYYGFGGTAWPEDYNVIFRGVVTDILSDSGKVTLQLNAPDDKKRTNIFKKVQTTLTTAVDDAATTLVLASVDGFLQKITGPYGVDSAFASFVRVGDEIIKYDAYLEPVVNGALLSISSANPAFVHTVGSGLPEGAPIVITTGGVLPSPLVSGNTYYVRSPVLTGFTLSSTPTGALINTSGSTQSGTHFMTTPPLIKGCTRAQLGTFAAAHDANVDVNTFYTLTGNGIDLALKIMASGNVTGSVGSESSAPYPLAVKVDAINVSPDGTRVQNGLFFKGVNVTETYGLVAGDLLFQLGAAFPNNVTDKEIIDIISTDLGDFVVIDPTPHADLVDMAWTEVNPIDADFISQYATLPDGCLMTSDEIDIDEHLRLKRLFLSSVDYTFYIKDGIDDAKDFIETQVYKPMAAYSLPRKARASVGYTIGPIPGTDIVTFDETNIKNASQIKVRRTSNKNFWNEIVYKLDESPTEDQFQSGVITVSATSKTRMPGSPNRTLIIEARGLRTVDLGVSIAAAQSNRRLKRYEFGAETITFESTLEAGYAVEIGDIVIFDGRNLNLPDSKTGVKGMAPRLLEIQNKDFQLKTGSIKFEAVDTKYDGAARYALISPSSSIKSGLSTTEFVIEESFSARFGAAEYRKWKDKKDVAVRIRNADFSVQGTAVIVDASSNKITVSPALAFTPSAGMIMEFAPYSNANTTEQEKLAYGFMRNSDFGDGQTQYQML